MIPADEALERLRAGNRRFFSEAADAARFIGHQRRTELVAGQEPFAIVLGCSDSRAPAEMVFDQGLGELFVIRIAGNVVAPSGIGSIEFAADQFGTRLVVVMGHSHCGAVKATLEELERPSENRSPNLSSIVGRIQPSVEGLLREEGRDQDDDLLKRAVRANIAASVDQLQKGSAILEGLIQNDGLKVIGAEYCLETGVVDFFDEG